MEAALFTAASTAISTATSTATLNLTRASRRTLMLLLVAPCCAGSAKALLSNHVRLALFPHIARIQRPERLDMALHHFLRHGSAVRLPHPIPGGLRARELVTERRRAFEQIAQTRAPEEQGSRCDRLRPLSHPQVLPSLQARHIWLRGMAHALERPQRRHPAPLGWIHEACGDRGGEGPRLRQQPSQRHQTCVANFWARVCQQLEKMARVWRNFPSEAA
mmetsp:Transcript_83719/g.233487  ORF Transcript_83719/g.233487 Transcript_83719/m.233487 type:complete len:219 (+) Transcript_83719:191-847(+)